MNKLKPCPFCGGYAKLRKEGEGYYVGCDNCGIRIRKMYLNNEVSPAMVQNAVIELWNKRVKE